MYRTEEFKNRITVKDYMRDYFNGGGFLEYCEKFTGHDQIWPCPLYDFNPVGYRKEHKYLYIIGEKIIFEQAAADKKGGKEDKTKQKAPEGYMNQMCSNEKDILTEKIKALEKSYPGSVGVSAGSCHACSRCKEFKVGGCRYSAEIRSFIEALGGNVGETAGELLGIELQWMRQKLPESFTLITGLLTDDPRVEL